MTTSPPPQPGRLTPDAQRPVDHTRRLPADVIARGADTTTAHGR